MNTCLRSAVLFYKAETTVGMTTCLYTRMSEYIFLARRAVARAIS